MIASSESACSKSIPRIGTTWLLCMSVVAAQPRRQSRAEPAKRQESGLCSCDVVVHERRARLNVGHRLFGDGIEPLLDPHFVPASKVAADAFDKGCYPGLVDVC